MEPFVPIEFVGEGGKVLLTVQIPAKVEIFGIYHNNDYWQVDCEQLHKVLPRSLMINLHFIRGLEQLRYLNRLFITQEPPNEHVLKDFESWPEAETVINCINRLVLPTDISICNCYFTEEETPVQQYREYFKSLKFQHKKIVEVVLSLYPLCLPIYIILWTMDWFENMQFIDERLKIGCITRIEESINKIK